MKTKSQRVGAYLPITLVLVALGAVALRSEFLRRDVDKQKAENRLVQDSLRRTVIEKSLLLSALNQALLMQPGETPLLEGRDEIAGTRLKAVRSDSLVIYFMSPYCSHCALNVDSLNKLHASGMKVVGVATQGSAHKTREWITRYGVRFPLLLEASGGLSQLVRTQSTPLTLTYRRRKLEKFHLGRLGQEKLPRAAASWTR